MMNFFYYCEYAISKIQTIKRLASFAGTEMLHFREFMNLDSKQFQFQIWSV